MLAKQGLFAASSFNLSTIFTEPIWIFQFYVAVAESPAAPLKVSSLLTRLTFTVYVLSSCVEIACGLSIWLGFSCRGCVEELHAHRLRKGRTLLI